MFRVFRRIPEEVRLDVEPPNESVENAIKDRVAKVGLILVRKERIEEPGKAPAIGMLFRKK